jgi:type II secretory pathway pseudopilin PulG
VVIGVITFLLSVLMPSLLVAKQQSKAMVCMSNEMQLLQAWIMYQRGNDGSLIAH